MRLDALPIVSFHRRILWLMSFIFFFELGDLNTFAFAAPAILKSWALDHSDDRPHRGGDVCRHVHRGHDGRMVFRSRGPEARA